MWTGENGHDEQELQKWLYKYPILINISNSWSNKLPFVNLRKQGIAIHWSFYLCERSLFIE